MPEQILISLNDVQSFRRVDPKFNSDRFNVFANEVQLVNLRDLFGQSLYYAFMADARTSGIYADLLNGKSYQYASETINYYGLTPVLCYWWLAIAAREGDLFLSQHGAINFVNNPQQNFESAKEKQQVVQSYMETAQVYANDVVKFLNTNSSNYPLWKGGKEENKTNFVSFKI